MICPFLIKQHVTDLQGALCCCSHCSPTLTERTRTTKPWGGGGGGESDEESWSVCAGKTLPAGGSAAPGLNDRKTSNRAFFWLKEREGGAHMHLPPLPPWNQFKQVSLAGPPEEELNKRRLRGTQTEWKQVSDSSSSKIHLLFVTPKRGATRLLSLVA